VRSYTFPDKFDFVICNPPFYEGDLPAASEAANLAKHSKELTLSALLTVIDTNLRVGGSFGLLLPYHRVDYFCELAAGAGFYLQEKLLVKQTPQHDFFRGILHFSRHRGNFILSAELCIKNAAGVYTEEFVELMKDYYLYL